VKQSHQTLIGIRSVLGASPSWDESRIVTDKP
jgi:hypothetical protein